MNTLVLLLFVGKGCWNLGGAPCVSVQFDTLQHCEEAKSKLDFHQPFDYNYGYPRKYFCIEGVLDKKD